MEIESRLLFQALKLSLRKLKFVRFRTCLIFSATCCAPIVQSSELDIKRAEIFREVHETIKDIDLAKQIVEVRMRREAAMKTPKADDLAGKKIEVIRYPRATASTTESTPRKQPEHEVHESALPTSTSFSAVENTVYIGIGSRLSVGYSHRLNDSMSMRTEISGVNNSNPTKVVDGTSYQFSQKDLSLGAYADWYPTSSSFRLSGGININRMQTTLKGIPNSIVSMNGSQVNLGADALDVEFKFPKITPYVGLGFGNRKIQGGGLHFYGDIGLMIGKYDAVTRTNLVGSQGLSSSNVAAETSKLRDDLYKWAFIPTASIGLTYGFN